MNWRPAKSAPRDGTPILGDFGYPWPLYALFDPHDEIWVYATIQACHMDNGKHNFYLEMETDRPGVLKRWMPLPKLPKP